MANTDFRLLFEFIAKTAQFNLNIDKARGKIDKFSQQATRTGKMLSTRLSLPLLAVGTLAVRQAAKFERLQVTLNTLNGSAEEGAKAFERLVQFSAETPLQLEELTRVNNMLMGFGQTSDDAFKSLKMLGDVAAVSGGNLTGIAVAFGQAAAEGRVMTRDLRQFINNGVPILDILSKSMGVARSEIMDMASEGKISFKVLQDGFKFATGEGGRFNDGLKVLSQTLEGLFSTLKDNVNIALATLGKEIAEALNLKEGIPALSKKIGELVKSFEQLSPSTQRTTLLISGLAIIIPPLLILLGAMAAAATAIATAVSATTVTIIALTSALVGLMALKISNAKNLIEGIIGKPLSLKKVNTELQLLQNNINAIAKNDFIGALGKNQSRQPFSLVQPKGTFDTPTTTLTTSGDEAMGGGLLGINPFKLGTGFQSLAGIIKTELPKMTNVTNGFALSLENMSAKFQDFEENAIVPIVEATKTFGEQIIPQIGVALQEGFAAIADGENPLKRLGTILKGLVVRLMAAAAAAMLLGAFLGGATGGSAILTKLGGIKGLFTSFSGIEFAKGGIVSGPTNALIGEYPGARSNPEVVAPLSKLKTMLGTSGAMQGEFVLRGQDLVVALQRAERNRNRFK
jgi:tape measure domain-containing protein|tara:strand:- start:5624 stop:7507 length:1884 start_codon:yes stop_codon:yes gene_type:complete